MAHKHAELMLKYAQDAMEIDKPWERWEFFNPEIGMWFGCEKHPNWHDKFKYRQKGSVITVGSHEFPKPYNGPMQHNQPYFIVVVSGLGYGFDVMPVAWQGSIFEQNAMNAGLIHLEHKAAAQHVTVLDKISKGEV